NWLKPSSPLSMLLSSTCVFIESRWLMREHRNVLVTGAAGFVGRALVKALQANELFRVTALARHSRDDLGFAVCPVGEMDGATSYTQVLAGIEVVIHTAARAHVMSDSAADPLAEYRRAN